jgi:hypothetical protein
MAGTLVGMLEMAVDMQSGGLSQVPSSAAPSHVTWTCHPYSLHLNSILWLIEVIKS